MTAAVLWKEIESRVAGGDRFAGLFATRSDRALALSAHVAVPGGIDTLDAKLPAGAVSYPALTPRLGAAFWYEREIHDHFGVVPEGHPRLAPLILPGSPEEHALPRHVAGYGVFTIPHSPVRSGVLESIIREQLIVPEAPETDEAVAAARARLAERTAALRRSVHVRHVDAGSDGSEEWEIQALLGPVYDIHRLGIFFTASPRHADVLLVTGAGSRGMAGPLRATLDAMPDPKIVIAAGTDAVSGGLLSQTEATTARRGVAGARPPWLTGGRGERAVRGRPDPAGRGRRRGPERPRPGARCAFSRRRRRLGVPRGTRRFRTGRTDCPASRSRVARAAGARPADGRPGRRPAVRDVPGHRVRGRGAGLGRVAQLGNVDPGGRPSWTPRARGGSRPPSPPGSARVTRWRWARSR
jgi:Ni,Fe-hydrogenase III small subunit